MRKLAVFLALAGIAAGVSYLIADGEQSPTAALASEAKAPAEEPEATSKADEAPIKSLVSGKVILLTEALKQRKIVSYADEIKGQVVLVTREGDLLPIVPDWRGRALYQDERLRDRPVDLVVNRRRGVPWLQVLSIYTFDEAGVRNMTDYWCDICAIPMYEIKECECCQGPIRLRYRPQELPADLKRTGDLK